MVQLLKPQFGFQDPSSPAQIPLSTTKERQVYFTNGKAGRMEAQMWALLRGPLLITQMAKAGVCFPRPGSLGMSPALTLTSPSPPTTHTK